MLFMFIADIGDTIEIQRPCSPALALFFVLDGDTSGVTSRSGRVIKKSTKLMDFTSPDDIETVKAKKMASATKKLHMVR
jgi:hypothetical protein